MIIRLFGNSFRYEMEKLSMAFFPDRKFHIEEGEEARSLSLPEDEPVITVDLQDSSVVASFENQSENLREASEEPISPETDPELAAGRALYRTLSRITGITPKWGILTGVRPSKVMRKHMEKDGANAAEQYFRDQLYVAPEKIRLAEAVSRNEEPIIARSRPGSFSLYISIPFCPRRCSYCSFVSHSISAPSARKLFPQYYEKLLQEIAETGKIAASCGWTLLSVYIGGGTPSTLSAEQITGLLSCVRSSFDLSSCEEFTFEAGRPDTTTPEKLKAIYFGGADRISINPQTMTDEILRSIGRNHTADDIRRTFSDARSIGFTNINMDLIAGLPGDTPENFERSLREVLALDPESVTVHTLAYKRSSSLIPTAELFSRGKDTAKMVDTSAELLYNFDYTPYYMYRQARSVGNLENVGWAKKGCESAYNVYMMEEVHPVLACGAGAVTKLKADGCDDITRLFNFKYPYEYVNRFSQLIAQKSKILDFAREASKVAE